ncbi:phosphatidylinositol 4-phosphate 5-kinase 5-like isoform X2 [Phoenix dactylifera]|uniref:Phosphatidylinositol 4-phosphate 5-kinase 5-like isoform X2 n=1 Tax=Phoenix dactylifera TaxID=42345 RepID=A0A8B8J0T4_PHODC|nr:phosphatidylinositol 4-phosphate 5-kinase 5-like isoform X2 [Phoenix dactylifera]
MKAQKGHGAKLTRTPSSLLRSPTLRSSVNILSTVDEAAAADVDDSDERKPHHLRGRGRPHLPCRPLLPALLPLIFFLFLFVVLVHLRDDTTLLSNLLLAAVVVSLAYIAARQSRFLTLRCLGVQRGESVQWFIGDGDRESKKRKINGKMVREGVEFYSNGDFYEGEFHKGRCNGSGVYNFFDKGRYEGDWVDGKYDGYGIENWSRGSRYRGQYRQGLRHGFGLYRFYSGDSYAGEWFSGQSHGVGMQTCSDGSCYAGEFKCGVKHGLGYYQFRNGDRYSGEYFGDKIHGFGVYNFANGHCYEGSWHEGKKQGFGAYTFHNGDIRSGGWDSGILMSPLPPSNQAIHQALRLERLRRMLFSYPG